MAEDDLNPTVSEEAQSAASAEELSANSGCSEQHSEPQSLLSRKREREVSVEPIPSQPTIDEDGDVNISQDTKEKYQSSKKNRVHLDSTTEEQAEDNTPQTVTPPRTGSPGLDVTSPQHEIKVRQISQGVEDISWKTKSQDDAAPEATITPDEPSLIDSEPADAEITSIAEPPAESSDTAVTPAAGYQEHPPAVSASQDSIESVELDKGLKRKLSERASSTGPEIDNKAAAVETQKRPRDDADKDDNPRETKRPSPPPEKEKPTSPTPKLGGFMSYASTSSPFASMKGKNLFSSSGASSSSFSLKSPSPALASQTSLLSGEASSSSSSSAAQDAPSTPKKTGFEAFASTSSPFASVARSKSPTGFGGSSFNRSKSPSRRGNLGGSNAFSAYAKGGAQGFSTPAVKRPRAGSPDSISSTLDRQSGNESNGAPDGIQGDDEESARRPSQSSHRSSFSDKLRAEGEARESGSEEEDTAKVHLTEQEVTTGEEDEETIISCRGKLFALSPENQWKERGTGTFKLNVRREDFSGARLVMRKEAVYNLLLNVPLFAGMKCFLANDPRYLRFSVLENGSTVHYNLRVSNPKIGEDLLSEINSYIPPPS